MDTKSSNGGTSNSGPGFIGALFLIFLTLKLCGVIEWSWIWVFAPLWIPVLLMVLILLFAYLSIWVDDLRINWKIKKLSKLLSKMKSQHESHS